MRLILWLLVLLLSLGLIMWLTLGLKMWLIPWMKVCWFCDEWCSYSMADDIVESVGANVVDSVADMVIHHCIQDGLSCMFSHMPWHPPRSLFGNIPVKCWLFTMWFFFFFATHYRFHASTLGLMICSTLELVMGWKLTWIFFFKFSQRVKVLNYISTSLVSGNISWLLGRLCQNHRSTSGQDPVLSSEYDLWNKLLWQCRQTGNPGQNS